MTHEQEEKIIKLSKQLYGLHYKTNMLECIRIAVDAVISNKEFSTWASTVGFEKDDLINHINNIIQYETTANCNK